MMLVLSSLFSRDRVGKQAVRDGGTLRRPAASRPKAISPVEQLESRDLLSVISGVQYLDLDADGIKDSGDPGLKDWIVELDADADGTVDATATTGEDGKYRFPGLDAGTYSVRTASRPNWAATSADAVELVLAGDRESHSAHFGVRPPAASLVEDPRDPAHSALLVLGTARKDKIALQAGKVPGSVQVLLNGRSLGTFSPTGRIIVFAGEGDDKVSIAPPIGLPALLFGGAGDDKLQGGNGPVALIGEGGLDMLVGGRGRDLLVGGTEEDRMNGGDADDILIGGATDLDLNSLAISGILDEWNSPRDYADRIVNLGADTGLDRENGPYLLNASTLHELPSGDRLTGKLGRDWFIADTEGGKNPDKIFDLMPNETVSVL